MQAKAHLKYLRISPRKVSVVLDLIRNKPAKYAMAILKNTNRAAAEPVAKLLKSAMSNAENNFGMNKDALVVKECYANAGPILKRIMPRAQGRAFRINKRTSHVTIVLEEKEA